MADTGAADLQQATTDIAAVLASVQSQGKAPVPGDAQALGSNILITGATGSFGTFQLAQLLFQTPPTTTIHCVVRCKSEQEGMMRLITRLQICMMGKFPMALAPRLAVIPGDITEERFGLPADKFEALAASIGSIYHSAAATAFDSYSALRAANVLALQHVLQLCLAGGRRRPLHLLSSLGFGKQFREVKITETTEVNPQDLVNLGMPGKVIGWSLSKYAAERIAQDVARDLGLPLTIYRLPLGFFEPINFTLLMARQNMVPATSLLLHATPPDQAAQYAVTVSLLPQRQHQIYHIVNSTDPRFASDVRFWLKEAGWDSPDMPWEIFAQSLAVVPPGPEFKCSIPYFIALSPFVTDGGQTVQDRYPVSAAHLEAALPRLEWLSTEAQFARARLVVLATVPAGSPLDHVLNDADGILRAASAVAGYSKLRSPEIAQTAAALLAAVKTESHINFVGKGVLASMLVGRLRAHLQLQAMYEQHPEILKEDIKRPIIVIGLNRTGTTLLHRLLPVDSKQLRAPLMFEMVCPVDYSSPDSAARKSCNAPIDRLPAGTDARFAKVNMAWSLVKGQLAHMQTIHESGPDMPEESFFGLEHDVASLSFTAPYHVPSFRAAMLARSMIPSFESYKRLLQYLQWLDRQRHGAAAAERAWVLKLPFYMVYLPDLLAVHPDARLVFTNRNVREVTGSWCSFIAALRQPFSSSSDPHEIGREELAFLREMWTRARTFRAAHPELAAQSLDVEYSDMVRDPLATVRKIYALSGLTLNDEVVHNMQKHLEEGRKGPQAAGHKYTLEQFGLTETAVNEAFSAPC